MGRTALLRRESERAFAMRPALSQQQTEEFISLAGEVLANPLVRGMSAQEAMEYGLIDRVITGH